MRILDRIRSAFVDVQTDCTAAAMTTVLQFVPPPVEPMSQRYAQASNDAADRAMEFGLAGKPITAEYAACLADAWAEAAELWRWIEDTRDVLARRAS